MELFRPAGPHQCSADEQDREAYIIYIYIYTYIYTHTYIYIYICICVSVYETIYILITNLLTEYEVCMEKYMPEICVEKTEGKYLPVQTKQTMLIRNLLYGFWLLFSIGFNKALCL